MTHEVRRGDVFYINNESPTQKARSEQGGIRPAVVISNDIGNSHAPVVTVACLTAKPKKKYLPTHVCTNALKRPSIVLCEQITTVSKDRLMQYVCTLPPAEMEAVDHAVSISLGLS